MTHINYQNNMFYGMIWQYNSDITPYEDIRHLWEFRSHSYPVLIANNRIWHTDELTINGVITYEL